MHLNDASLGICLTSHGCTSFNSDLRIMHHQNNTVKHPQGMTLLELLGFGIAVAYSYSLVF